MAYCQEFSVEPLDLLAEVQRDGSLRLPANTGEAAAGTKVLLARSNFVLERMCHAAHSELVRTFQNETETGCGFFFLYRRIR